MYTYFSLFNKVGLFLPQSVFSHGQLYVALSRNRNRADLKLQIEDYEGQGKLNSSNNNTDRGNINKCHNVKSTLYPTSSPVACHFTECTGCIFVVAPARESLFNLHFDRYLTNIRTPGEPCLR